MRKPHHKIIAVLLTLVLLITLLPTVGAVTQSAADHVIISQIYGAGGNKGAVYNADFIELYNPTNYDIDLSGWSLQYGSATGTWPCKSSSRYLLSGTIKAHSYYLIVCSEGSNGDPLPVTADLSGCGLSLAESKGKLALVCSTELIASKSDPIVVDFVGYGSANESEGAPAPAPSKTASIIRREDGVDTDSNADDFTTVTPPTPRNGQTTQPGGSETVIIPVEDGTYIFSHENATFSALPDSVKSGYPSAGNLESHSRLDVFTITNTGNNRFTITDVYGRMYFLTGSDSAFQVAPSPIYGHLWTLIDAGNNTCYIQNIHTGQYITYSSETGSWWCYPYPSASAKITLTPARLLPCSHDGQLRIECTDESRHRIICDSCGEVIDDAAAHSFTDGYCICALMQWVTDPKPGKIYKLGLYHGYENTHLFLTGRMDGFYLATTEELGASVNVCLEEAENGYFLRCLIGDDVKYLDIYQEDGYVRIGFRDTPSCRYTWDEEHSTLTTLISGRTYYLGGYQSYKTISPVCDLVYPAHFYEIDGTLCAHIWQSATCTAPKVCKLCGETDGQPLGHNFTNYRSNEDATCTNDGTKTAKCDRCDAVDTISDTGSAGHTDEDGNFRCDRCGCILCDACYDSPSDRDHLCDQCKTKLSEHSYSAWAETKEATCTKDGTAQRKCNCGAIETKVVPAMGHSFTRYHANHDATCTEDGTKTAKCDRCNTEDTVNEPGSALGHALVKVEEVTATEHATGIMAHYKCQNCNNLYADAAATRRLSPTDVILPQLPPSPKPTDPPKDDEPTYQGILLDFSSIANRELLSNERQIWSQNGITLTNSKGKATANIGDFYDPVRLYKNTVVTIDYSSIAEIRFYCDTPAYAKSLLNSMIAGGYPAVLNEKTVTVTMSQPFNQISFALSDGQVRLDAIGISPGPELPPNDQTEPTQPIPTTPEEPSQPLATTPLPNEPTIPEEPTVPPATNPPAEETIPQEPTIPPVTTTPTEGTVPTEPPPTEAPTVPAVTVPAQTTPTQEETTPSTDPGTTPTDPTQAATDSSDPSHPCEPSDPTQAPAETVPTPSATEETNKPTVSTDPKGQNPMIFFLVILTAIALGICLFGIIKKPKE